MDLRDKVALITGGRRIGAVVAARLAARGVDVALSYRRSRVEADLAAEDVRAAGRRSLTVAADLSQPDAAGPLVDAVVAGLGGVDILINMASVYVRKPFDELTAADWNAAADVDLRAAFLCARAVAPHMRHRGGGRIVNFGDWVARSGRPRYQGYVPYYVAKAGVIALTEALALELAADNILVNAIAPGPILAPPGTSADELKAVEDATPLGRWGGEDEIAKAILGLLDSDFITGETIRVDGGAASQVGRVGWQQSSRLQRADFFINIEHMPGRGHLGAFEMMVMLALIRVGEDAYGVAISRELEEHTGRDVLLGSVYATLERLVGKGLVSSSVGEPTPERGGRAKRYFRITPKGLRELRDTRRALTALWQNIPALKGKMA